MDPDRPPSRILVLGTITFYMFSAISMTLLNKHVLSLHPFPTSLLLCQALVAVLLLSLSGKTGFIKLPDRFDRIVAKRLSPLVGINIIGLIFNNYCLQHVDASFHQVARGLVLPFTILISVLYLKQYPSYLTLSAALTVTCGFFAGVIFDPNHDSSRLRDEKQSSVGIIYGVISSLTSAIHAILIKKGLVTITLAYYNNILSAIALCPLILMTGEWGGMANTLVDQSRSFLYGAFMTGVFGFLISLASFLSIKITSPVTHMISSASRGVLQTILAAYFFHDVISPVVGIFLIIFGSILYVYSMSPSKTSPVLPVDTTRKMQEQ